jgi:hypothetical protein
MGAGWISCRSYTYRTLDETMCIISSALSDASKTSILPQDTTYDVGMFAWPHQRLGTAYESRKEGVVKRTNSSNPPEHPAQSLGGDCSYAGALKAFEFEMSAGVHDGAEITCIPWLVQIVLVTVANIVHQPRVSAVLSSSTLLHCISFCRFSPQYAQLFHGPTVSSLSD